MSRRTCAALAVVTAYVLCSCAPAPSAPSSVAPPPAAESAAERLTRLYEAAKTEGRVAFYSSMNNEEAKVVLPKFEQRFPGVKVEHTRATGSQVVQKIVMENKAGQHLFDLVDTSVFEVKFIIDQGYTQPYTVTSVEDYPAEARDPKGAWIANRIVPLVIGFNTQKGVKVGDINGWADLCDKRYEGRIAVEQDDVVVYSALRKLYGDAEAQRVLRCVAANKPSLRTGHTEIDNLLPAGEFAVTFASHSYRLAGLKYEQQKPSTG